MVKTKEKMRNFKIDQFNNEDLKALKSAFIENLAALLFMIVLYSVWFISALY